MNVIEIGTHRMSKPKKPMDPAEAARLAYEQRRRERNPENWGIDRETLKLEANARVDAEHHHDGKVRRAMRWDIFELLHVRKVLSQPSHAAVRRLQSDLAVMHRTQGASDAIRTSSGSPWIAEDFSIARRDAGARVEAVLSRLRPIAAKLLRALAEGEVVRGRPPNWHAVVEQLTGDKNRISRARTVIETCDDLAEAYAEIDNQPAERRAS